MKMSWERFKPGDQVFVYFPQKKIGCSPKLTSFWRGPFEVLEKWSDVLYAVNCRRKGERQIIHCDRLRKKRNQTLRGEDTGLITELLESYTETDEEEQETDKIVESVDELVESTRPKRKCGRPKWLEDYESY